MSPRPGLFWLRRSRGPESEPEAAEPIAPEPGPVGPPAFEPEAPEPEAPEGFAPEPEAPEPEAPDEEPEEPGSVTVAEAVAGLAGYRRAVLSWVAEDGYPMNVDVEIEVKTAESTIRFGEPPGFRIPPGTMVAITESNVHPLPDGGFDERRHLTVWGRVSARPRGRYAVMADRIWAWGEDDLPLTASYGRRMAQARRYFEDLSVGHTAELRPRLYGRLALYRAVHAPFLAATFIPLVLGLAVAIRAGVIDLVTALMTLALAGAVHLGLNVAGGLFDLLHDPGDDGHSRAGSSGTAGAFGYALAEIGTIPRFAVGCYLAAGVLGLAMLVLRGSPGAIVLALLGLLLVVAYGRQPMRLADRGLGEISAAIGFGPVLLLGTYAIQSRGALSVEALLLSIAIGLLAGLVVYVGEIPCRVVDARAGRMTLPVRWPRAVVLRGFDIAVGGLFVGLAAGVAAGLLPIPVLLALLAIPLAMRVRSDLARHYEAPNALTAALAASARLQMNVALLLIGGYLLTIADQILLGRAPFIH